MVRCDVTVLIWRGVVFVTCRSTLLGRVRLVGLFCGHVGLICRDIGLICGDIGLFMTCRSTLPVIRWYV